MVARVLALFGNDLSVFHVEFQHMAFRNIDKIYPGKKDFFIEFVQPKNLAAHSFQILMINGTANRTSSARCLLRTTNPVLSEVPVF